MPQLTLSSYTTIVLVTISDYSSIIACASSSLVASGMHYQTTLNGDVVGGSALGAASFVRLRAESLASSLQSSATAAGSSLQASGSAAVSLAESPASAGSGSSGTSEIKLQPGLIAGSLLLGAVALLL